MKNALEKKEEDRLLGLISDVQEETLTEAGRRELNALLKGNRAARNLYRRHMELHAQLHLDYDTSYEGMPPVMHTTRAPQRRRSFKGAQWTGLALASCLVLCALIAWGRNNAAETFVTIKEVHSARWESGHLPTAQGSRLGKGTMRLSEGLVVLEFDSGATVNLEAPSTLSLIDEMNVKLEGGTVLADIPESAIGFRIETESADVVDFGTRFSVSVDPTTAELRTQVYEGMVEVQAQDSDEYVSIKEGQHHKVENGILGEALDGYSEPVVSTQMSRMNASDSWLHLETSKDAYTGRVSGHESADLLYVKHGCLRDSPHRKAYLGFNLSALTSMQIKEAQLSVYFSPTGWGLASHVPDATFSVYGLRYTQSDWAEETLSKENAPANVEGHGSKLVSEQVKKLGSFTLAQGLQRGAFSISGDPLQSFLRERAGEEITLIVVRDTVEIEDAGLVHGFASRRHPVLPAPTLSIRID